MDNRIKPDFSISLTCGEEQYLLDRVFDNVHLFPWLGHAILKIVGTKGYVQIHTTIEEGRRVAERAGIKPLEREEISEREYEKYVEAQANNIDEWFGEMEL